MRTYDFFIRHFIAKSPDEVWAMLPDGPHMLELTFDVEVFRQRWPSDPIGPRLAYERRSFQRSVTVAAVSASRIDLVHEPLIQAGVAEAAGVGPVQVYDNKGEHWVHAMCGFRQPPVDIAADIYLREAGREWQVGHVWSRAGVTADSEVKSLPALSPSGRTVDVVFRSNQSLARETTDMTRIWEGELKVPNCRVDRSGFGQHIIIIVRP
jgi:hypothetical protein